MTETTIVETTPETFPLTETAAPAEANGHANGHAKAPKAKPAPKGGKSAAGNTKAATNGKSTAKAAATATKAKPAPKGGKAKTGGPSIRERVFKLLNKQPCTGAEVMKQLGLHGIPSLLKDEGVCDKPRIRRKLVEGQRAVVYELTAAGRRDLEAGKVDDNAAPGSGGKDWPQGR